LATLLAYRKAYHDKIWDVGTEMSRSETLALAAYGGSCITRECSKLAFKEKGRSLQASDLTEHVHTAFLNVIGEREETPNFKLGMATLGLEKLNLDSKHIWCQRLAVIHK